MGYAKEKEKISVPKSMGKRKKKKRDSTYLKIKESHAKRGASSVQKNSTHIAHLDLIVWPVFSIGFDFLLCNMYSTSMRPLLPLPWAPPKSFTRNREIRGDTIPWWEIIDIERYEKVIWGAKFYFHLKNLSKNPSYFAGRVWLIWLFVLVLKNCDKEVWRGWSAMKKGYTRKGYHGLQFASAFICQVV